MSWTNDEAGSEDVLKGSIKRASELGVGRAPVYCRWVDVIGRNRAQLERVRKRMALPPRLVPLSLVEYLHPTVIRVRPASFLVTYFTTPSPRAVFTRHPVYLWLAEGAIVTISPWARRRSVLGAARELDETRDDFLCRVVGAAVSSHEQVGSQLNEAFFAADRGASPYAWHEKERRVTLFKQFLNHQLAFLRAVGVENAKMQQLHEQLEALALIAHHAERKLRESGSCRVCGHAVALGGRRGH